MNWLTRFKALFVLTYTGFLGNIAVIYYLSRGLSYSEIGLATAFSALGFFLFEVPTGVVGDRVSRKTSVLIGLSIYPPLSLLLLLFLRNFWMLLVSELISVLGGASFISGSLQAWFFDNLKSEGREGGEFKEIWRSIQKATVLASSSTTIAGAFMAQLWGGFEVPILLSLILHLTMIPPHLEHSGDGLFKARNLLHEPRHPLLSRASETRGFLADNIPSYRYPLTHSVPQFL
ncbi:MFS transporter [Thermococcus peptonophilus]|uniref:hypothetical protein n=1 Tax=Thermococcus peptonophilus TaxID=53952 RepID=UPI000A4AFBF4